MVLGVKEIVFVGPAVLPLETQKYSYPARTPLSIQKDRNYKQIADLTTHKPIGLVKYHVHSMLKQSGRPEWTQK